MGTHSQGFGTIPPGHFPDDEEHAGKEPHALGEVSARFYAEDGTAVYDYGAVADIQRGSSDDAEK